jgi:hypothetical protein
VWEGSEAEMIEAERMLELKELVGNNCEWCGCCAVGELLSEIELMEKQVEELMRGVQSDKDYLDSKYKKAEQKLQDEKNSRERLMLQNNALAKQYVRERELREQYQTALKIIADPIEYFKIQAQLQGATLTGENKAWSEELSNDANWLKRKALEGLGKEVKVR